MFDKDGHAVIGWYTNSSGNSYYYDKEGRRVKGIVEIDGSIYYFDPYMMTDYTLREGDYIYYFGKDGKCTKKEKIS